MTDHKYPVSGSTASIWATVFERQLPQDQRPDHPSFLAVTIRVSEGIAGVGWYDDSGLAEEIFVTRSSDAQRISLTVWQPQHCQRLIIRNVQNKNVSVELAGVEWIPINPSTLNNLKTVGINRNSDGFFLDQAFSGQLAETLWKSWRKNRFEKLKRYQTLNRLVRMAWNRCPGYRDFWRLQGWHPSNLRALEDIHDIPIITKDLIRSNLKDFTVDDRDLAEFTTSGTTGSPFTFKYGPLLNAAHLSAVAIAASYGDSELLPWQQRAMIIRRSVRGASATGAGGSLIINAAAIHDIDLIWQLIESYRPTLFFGWPSYASNIVQAVGDKYRFRIAILGSENISSGQLDETGKIARTVVATYGLSEGAGFAMRCHTCGAYTELDTHGIISLSKRPDGLFDIIGTSFWSRGTLFIRYNTGDLTFGRVDGCPSCPHSMLHFKTPSGRSQEFIVDKHGKRHALAMIVGAEAIVPLLKRVQLFDFVQAAPGAALLRYVTLDRTPLDEDRLIAEFRKILSDEFVLTCRYDERILDLRSGLSSSQKWAILKQGDFC
jgi:phenylacetate-coenzyme A ligase PaaK-like adenylate-forming protein